MALIIRNSFYQGVKSTVDPLVIPGTSIWKGINVRSDVSGILRLREGSVNIFPSVGNLPIQGLVYAFEQLLFVFGKNLYKYDRETDVLAQIDNTDLTATETEHVSLLKWSSGGEEIVYIFGGMGIFETDGNSVSPITPYVPEAGEETNMLANPTGPQDGKIVALKASLSQRIAVAGLPSSPNTVYFSAPLDVTYFPADQVIQLPDDGAVITGMANFQNSLVIFRDKDIWAFFGTDLTDPSAMLVLQDASTGCVAPKTIQHVPDLGICFLGRDNIYSLQGLTGIENQAKAISISDDVAIPLRRAISYGKLEDVSAVYFRREYRICFPLADQDERVFRLTLQNGPAWYTDNGPLTNNYIVIKGELFGSYYMQGSLHQISMNTVFDETVYTTVAWAGGQYNDFMFNNGFSSDQYRELTGIPLSVTFKREDLQPGPSRIKRVFLYVNTMGTRQNKYLYQFGNVFNNDLFNTGNVNHATLDTSTEQDFKVTLIVDGNEIQVDFIEVKAKKIHEMFMARSEPIRIFEARLRPSLKGHFMQIRIDSINPGQLISILGYGIDYQPKGRIRGIREGVTGNKA